MAWLGRHRGRAALVPACVLLVHPLAMAVLAPYRGPGFQEGRYSIHLLPVALLLLAVVFGPWREAVASSLNEMGGPEMAPQTPPVRDTGSARNRVSVRNGALAASLARVLYPAVPLVPLVP